MTTAAPRLTALTGGRPPTGDSRSATHPPADLATTARLCDELAALAEHGHARATEQLAALERGDTLTTVRTAIELAPILSTLAASLGEMHGLLEEIAHTPGGAS